MMRWAAAALLIAGWVGPAPASTGWVERLEIVPPPLLREELDGGVRLRLGGDEPLAGEGVPDLPSLMRPLAGYPGYRIEVRVVETEHQDEAGVRVVPALTMRRTMVADNVYTSSWVRAAADAVYARDGLWPDSLAQVDEAWQGTNRVARLVVRPVQWNPQSQQLRVHTRLVLELIYRPE